jgi:hypothetical protein
MTELTAIKNEDKVDLHPLLMRYESAKNKHQNWKDHWEECYEYALPQRSSLSQAGGIGAKRVNTLYDGTAMDAVEQLASSLLANLTPPWAQWFGFKPGPDLSADEASALAPVLEDIAKKIQSHLDRSNFSVEMHQCFLDLAVGGTATLYFEETDPGAFSAFKFSAIPLQDVVLEEGDDGFLKGSYRELSLTLPQIVKRYGDVELPLDVLREGEKDSQLTFDVLESVLPEIGAHQYHAILMHQGNPVLLKSGQFNKSPTISFRWMKSPGEIYGRSPVMKALPDIKTANKVVELILKNASIAVTGIWQADDDGVLNPANIELVPGAIIPKAVGSQGLKPLEMPGRFDVSELVLKDLRARIRHALMADKLGAIVDKRMSATEVLERSNEMAMLLGATYGRLQTELITPLIQRAFSILRRRGEIPDIALDGRYLALDYRSPLAKAQGQRDVQNVLVWLESVSSLGAEASLSVDVTKTVKMLAESLSIPRDLIRETLPIPQIAQTNVEGGE